MAGEADDACCVADTAEGSEGPEPKLPAAADSLGSASADVGLSSSKEKCTERSETFRDIGWAVMPRLCEVWAARVSASGCRNVSPWAMRSLQQPDRPAFILSRAAAGSLALLCILWLCCRAAWALLATSTSRTGCDHSPATSRLCFK